MMAMIMMMHDAGYDEAEMIAMMIVWTRKMRRMRMRMRK